MERLWSTEYDVAEHRDLQANSMALDSTGKFCLLAGRRCLAIVDIGNPSVVLKKGPRQGKWEIRCSEWNPLPQSASLFAMACNNVCELTRWREEGSELVEVAALQGHTRNISSLNWHRFDSNMLATASIDTYINVWDVRETRRPAYSMSSVAGAGVVTWNKIEAHLLCSSHDGDIRIWDSRKASSPLDYISAHLKQIYGLDWSSEQASLLASSSMDCTVKFFDVKNPKKAERTLQTVSPVWKINFTPFGKGLVTVVVPQLRRGENSLLLWNTQSLVHPIHTFVGHTDVVLDFNWKRNGYSDFQLVTWAKDNTLRIWSIDKHIYSILGGSESKGGDEKVLPPIPEVQPSPDHHPTDSSVDSVMVAEEAFEADILDIKIQESKRKQSDEIDVPNKTPKSLEDEFSLVNLEIDNVRLDEVDCQNRSCVIRSWARQYRVSLKMDFPIQYPHNKAPTFYVLEEGTLLPPDTNKEKLISALTQTAKYHVKRNRSCLEPCLRQLGVQLDESLGRRRELKQDNYLESDIPSNLYGSFQDARVPFPRTSGARFCGPNVLVSFTRPVSLKRSSTADLVVTPRALSALGQYLSSNSYSAVLAQSPTQEAALSVSHYYYQDKNRPKGKRTKSKSDNDSKDELHSGKKAGKIYCFDAMGLTLLSKTLAENYVTLGPIKKIDSLCSHNALQAQQLGRTDLVRTWNTAALMTSPYLRSPRLSDGTIPPALTPFGREAAESLLDHYLKLHDIQTVAMLCCIFGGKYRMSRPRDVIEEDDKRKKSSSTGSSPYHTIHPSDTSLQGWNYPPMRQHRSNSWSEEQGVGFPSPIISETSPIDYLQEQEQLDQHRDNCKILDPKKTRLYDCYKKAYANLLYRWGLLDARIAVMKFVSDPDEPHEGPELFSVCPKCRSRNTDMECQHCRHYTLLCTLCHTPVKGRFTACLACGHGGHMYHIAQWFEVSDECPSGCGCQCLINNGDILTKCQQSAIL